LTYRWQVLGLAHKELRVKIWQQQVLHRSMHPPQSALMQEEVYCRVRV
jgi:hypothetical protein